MGVGSGPGGAGGGVGGAGVSGGGISVGIMGLRGGTVGAGGVIGSSRPASVGVGPGGPGAIPESPTVGVGDGAGARLAPGSSGSGVGSSVGSGGTGLPRIDRREVGFDVGSAPRLGSPGTTVRLDRSSGGRSASRVVRASGVLKPRASDWLSSVPSNDSSPADCGPSPLPSGPSPSESPWAASVSSAAAVSMPTDPSKSRSSSAWRGEFTATLSPQPTSATAPQAAIVPAITHGARRTRRRSRSGTAKRAFWRARLGASSPPWAKALAMC